MSDINTDNICKREKEEEDNVFTITCNNCGSKEVIIRTITRHEYTNIKCNHCNAEKDYF